MSAAPKKPHDLTKDDIYDRIANILNITGSPKKKRDNARLQVELQGQGACVQVVYAFWWKLHNQQTGGQPVQQNNGQQSMAVQPPAPAAQPRGTQPSTVGQQLGGQQSSNLRFKCIWLLLILSCQTLWINQTYYISSTLNENASNRQVEYQKVLFCIMMGVKVGPSVYLLLFKKAPKKDQSPLRVGCIVLVAAFAFSYVSLLECALPLFVMLLLQAQPIGAIIVDFFEL